ncbi:GAP family protein [Rhodococcus sp. NPDC058514]|uniref:GAP family protein n=1 Tax=unclassified Rhodococcus (in: high G+C Gram-positive bacteria) TaxID=192944 RepID=UPI00364B2777
MGELVAQLLPEMIGLILTPGAILGCILLLRSQRPAANAAAFGAGFLVVYLFIAIAALLGGASDPDSTAPEVSHGAGLAVGVLFLAAGIWLSTRPRRAVNECPKLLRELETAGPRKALVIGIALGVLYPNLFIMMSGMSIIASSPVGTGGALLAALILLVSAALDFVTPVGAFLLGGDRARAGLAALEDWMLRHSRALSLAVLFVFGALFTIRGIVNLA